MTTETRPRASRSEAITPRSSRRSTSSKIGSGSQLVTSTGALLALLYTEPEDVRIQALATRLKVTQRTVMHLTAAVVEAGWATVERKGRENRYMLTFVGAALAYSCAAILRQEGATL